jgi:hypothetical protein
LPPIFASRKAPVGNSKSDSKKKIQKKIQKEIPLFKRLANDVKETLLCFHVNDTILYSRIVCSQTVFLLILQVNSSEARAIARFIHKEADIYELKNHLEQKGYKKLLEHFSLIIQRNNDGVCRGQQSSAVVCRGQHDFSVKEA